MKLPTASRCFADSTVLFSRTILLFFGFFLLSAMAGAGLQAWLITVLHNVKGLDLSAASTALTGYMAGSAAGVLVGGWFADAHQRHVLPFVILLTIISASLLIVVNILTFAPAFVFLLMLASGFTSGASRTPRDVMLKDASPPGQIGKIFGFVSAGLPLGTALTPVPFGFLIDRHHPELVLFLVAALLMTSLLCMGSARASSRTGAAVTAPAE